MASSQAQTAEPDPFALAMLGDKGSDGMDLSTEKGVEEAMEKAMASEQEKLDPIVSEDLEDAFARSDIEHFIPTGNMRAGRPVFVKVVVRDPKDPALATKYMLAMRRNPAGAIRALWKSCVVSPRSVCDDDEVYAKLSTQFKTALGMRLLHIIGLTDDFLSGVRTPSPTSDRPAKTSSTKSPTPGESTPAPSDASSTPETSSEPTPTSPTSGSATAPTPSSTSATPPPRPSTAPRPPVASRTLSSRSTVGVARSA